MDVRALLLVLPLAACDSGGGPKTQDPSVIDDAWSLLQSRIDAEGNNASILLDRSKVYVLDSGLDLRNYSGITINGNGATIRRVDSSRISSSLAEDYAGSTEILLTHVPDNYRVGDHLAIARGQSIADLTPNPRRITSISGRLVTLEHPFDGEWQAGDTVFKSFALIVGLPSQIAGGSNPGTIIENITFDGNARNNQINYGWRVNGTIGLHGGKTSEIRYNRFIDIPNETIIGHGVSIHDNVFDGLNGSAFHTSVHDATVAINGRADFTRNDVRNVNRAPRGMNGHSEGAITFSWGGGNLTVHDNYFFSETGHYGVLGRFSEQLEHTDENLVVTENEAYNFEYIIDLRPARNILITRNTFSNAGVNDFSYLKSRSDIRLGCNIAADGTVIVVAPGNDRCE